MDTVRESLRDADPLRHEPYPFADEHDRLRRAVIAAAADVRPRPSVWSRRPLALVATLALIVVVVAVGFQIWSPRGATLEAAAIQFEIRLAEDQQAAGLRAARIADSGRVVYLHQEAIVTNDDIAQSSLVSGEGPSQFGVRVRFNAAGADRMQQATAGHVGKPLAILLDNTVVAVPVVRSPISASAVLSGNFTKAEAEKIAHGIGIR